MDITTDLFQLIKTPIGDGFKHYHGLSEYMKILNERLEELNSRKEDKELRLITELNLPGKAVKRELELRLRKVEKINEEVKCIEEEVENVKFFNRVRLGKKVYEKIEEVKKVHENGRLFDGLVETLGQSGDILPTTTLFEGGITLQRKVEEIWACLMNDEVRKVGVCGMGGIGKTTAMKHINNRIVVGR